MVDLIDRDGPLPLPPRVDTALGGWRFSLNMNSGKFELFRAARPDLAHLTIAWGTRSRTLDVHLTHRHEKTCGDPKEWTPLFQVPLVDVEASGAVGNEVVRQFVLSKVLPRYRRFRPGWLAAHGYVIGIMGRDPAWRWFSTALVPKERGKFRIKPEPLLHPEQYPLGLVGYYDARVLHLEALRAAGTFVQAARLRHGRFDVPESIVLSHTMGPTGVVGWWGMKRQHMLSAANAGFARLFDWFATRRTPEHAAKFEQVVAGLGLEDDDGTRAFVQSIRALLVEGRNPVRQPYREDRALLTV